MSTLDVSWIRAQFPALNETVNGQPALFADGPGGTQVTKGVIEAMTRYLTRANANTHGAFLTSARTDQVIAEAQQAMADFLGCDRDEVVFGANMTSLTFALGRSIGRELAPGDEIVLTRLDHDANFAPWQALAEQGAVVKVVDIDTEDCTLDIDDLRQKITERTKLVAVGYASNAVGTINDVAEVVRLARAVGAWSFIDAVHYAPHGPLDVRALDCDFLACSPYKFFGPHAGTLYGKREHLLRLRPYKVRPATEELPGRWMTGTQSHEAMAGVTAAIDYLAELGRRVTHTPPTEVNVSALATSGVADAAPSPQRRAQLLAAMQAIQAYERKLSEQLVGGLLAIPGLTLYGIHAFERFFWRTPTVAVRLAGFTPRELAERLGEQGIFTWDGHYYALNLAERLGVQGQGGMLRIGFVHYNTPEEVERLLTALRHIAERP